MSCNTQGRWLKKKSQEKKLKRPVQKEEIGKQMMFKHLMAFRNVPLLRTGKAANTGSCKTQNRLESSLSQFPEILSSCTYWNGESLYFMLNAHMDLTGPNGVHFSYATSPVKFHWDTAQNIKTCQDEPSVAKRKSERQKQQPQHLPTSAGSSHAACSWSEL